MPYGVYLSASGAHAQSHRMQVLSHNLSNVNTPGFKPEQAVVQSRFAEMIAAGEVPEGLGGADDLGGGATIHQAVTQFDVGPIETTQRDTDFAIHDPNSFFVVRKGDESFLTRAGNFLFDARGRLVNQAGDEVLGSNGQPIRIEPDAPYRVQPDGIVTQDGFDWEIMLARPKQLGDLTRVGDNLFKPLAEFDLVPPAERQVVAGSLERSAVSPTAAMMELIETSRAYEANVQMIRSQDSVLGSLIGRVLQR